MINASGSTVTRVTKTLIHLNLAVITWKQVKESLYSERATRELLVAIGTIKWSNWGNLLSVIKKLPSTNLFIDLRQRWNVYLICNAHQRRNYRCTLVFWRKYSSEFYWNIMKVWFVKPNITMGNIQKCLYYSQRFSLTFV